MIDDAGLSARDVTVTYRNGVTALRAASFAIPRGTITALVGMNGAGKSTLFKAIMGFVPLASGAIRILGMDVRSALRSGLVAYVPQAEEVDWTFPVLVEDVVMMGRYGHMGPLRRPRAADRLAVTEALERVDMAALRRRQIGELSGGQRKRVFLARALAQGGQVILLDEPFTGVDVQTEAAIIGLLRDLRGEGRVMLVSTHDLGSVPDFCDRVVLVNGTVLAHGPTASTFTRPNLERTFGGLLRQPAPGLATTAGQPGGRVAGGLAERAAPLAGSGERDGSGEGPHAGGNGPGSHREGPLARGVDGEGEGEGRPGGAVEGPYAGDGERAQAGGREGPPASRATPRAGGGAQ